MSVARFDSAPLAGAGSVLLLAALLLAASPADARRLRGGGSRSSSPPAPSKVETPPAEPTVVRPRVIIRSSGSSTGSAAGQAPLGAGFVPIAPGAPQANAEELERQREQAAMQQRMRLEKAAAEKAAAERAEAERLAAEQAEAERAARRAEEERLQASRLAAAQAQKQREEAAIAADVDRVLQRTLADHPVLATPAGEPLLRSILARQKALAGRGTYPSVALVQAVADHAHALTPAQAALAPERSEPAPAVQARAAAAPPAGFGGCRWVTPTKWGCQ